MKNIKKMLAFLCILVICIMLKPADYARADESASVSISSASGTVGDTVTITVTVSASDDIGGAFIYVSYDNTILRPTSGGNSGVVTFGFTDGSAYGSTESTSMSFEIIGAGTTTLSVTGASKIVCISGEQAQIQSSSPGKVTGRAPANYSSDNSLKSLQISPGTLSPAFSPDITTYNATVDKDVERLVVSAVPNDDNAKVSTTGTRMDPGRNTTTITVTAEDGSTRKYVIYTIRQTDGGEATQVQTEQSTEAESTSQSASLTVSVDGKNYLLSSDFSSNPLPEGYEEIEYDYNGQKVRAGKGIKTKLILMYLETSDGNGKSGFYIYDESNKTFSLYNTVTEPDITYVILPITASADKPEGYTLTKFTMNGKEVQVLIDSERNFCLFYGVSSLGEKGWFRYRVSDGTIQVYSENAVVPVDSQGDSQVAKTSGSRFWIAIVTLMTVIAVVFIIITILLSAKLSKLKKVFNMASRDSVDLDEYAKKEIDEYDMDDYEELSTKVSYGDDKSGKNDVEELNLFDIDDEK